MDTTQKPITSLSDLTKLTKASLSGGLGSQEFFYKADEVEALVAHLTIVPADDNALGFAKQELSAIRINHPGGFVGFVPQEPVEQYVSGLLVRIRNLQAFKDFVHTTLDNAGVDKHEEQNATTGCRVGARLADLINAAAAPSSLANVELTVQRDMALEAADQLFRSGFINDTRRADMRRRISLHFKKAIQKGQADV